MPLSFDVQEEKPQFRRNDDIMSVNPLYSTILLDFPNHNIGGDNKVIAVLDISKLLLL